MKLNLFATALLLLAAVACGDELSNPDDAPLRFDVVSSDPVEQGERLSAILGCVGCHTPDLTGEDWSDPELGVLWSANLTRSAADNSEAELAVMISEGRRPDRALLDMPSYLFSEIHPDDLTALVAYLKTLAPKGVRHPEPTIGTLLAERIASGDFKNSAERVAEMKDQAPPDLGPKHVFARAVLRATCAECHGMDLNGSTEQLIDAPPRPSLRIVGAYSIEEFSKLMKTGTGFGGRELNLMGGVSRWRYSRFTDNEITAVYEYLAELARQSP